MVWELEQWGNRIAFLTEENKYNYDTVLEDSKMLAEQIGKRTFVFIITSIEFAMFNSSSCLSPNPGSVILPETAKTLLSTK